MTHLRTTAKPLPLLLSALFLAAGSAHAQPTQQLDQINVNASNVGGQALIAGATKTASTLLETPQSISLVTQESLRKRAALSTKDALDYVSSVVAGQGEGRRDEFYIRGFYSLRDTSVDGMRDDNLYFRDLATTEQIEVVKGAAAALYGRGSAGGLINRVSKKPKAGQASEISATLGSDRERRVSVDVGGALNDQVNGRLIGVYPQELLLESASWVADSGRFHDADRFARQIQPVALRPAAVAAHPFGHLEQLHELVKPFAARVGRR